MGKTLEGFAAKTPYISYAGFLTSTAIPNATLFGNAIRTTELLAGIIFVFGGIILLAGKRIPSAASWVMAIACFAAALMNLNFFLAAGWTSPSTWGVNMIMTLVEIILGVFYIANAKELAS